MKLPLKNLLKLSWMGLIKTRMTLVAVNALDKYRNMPYEYHCSFIAYDIRFKPYIMWLVFYEPIMLADLHRESLAYKHCFRPTLAFPITSHTETFCYTL